MKWVRFVMGALAMVVATVLVAGVRPLPGLAQSSSSASDPNAGRRANRVLSIYNGPGSAFPRGEGDGELHKLMENEASSEREVRRLVGEYGRTEKEAERAKIKSKLSEVLDKQFDLQQKRREMEVSQIEAQLKKLRELMRKRSEARQTIVDRRLDQLLREADGLGWSSPASGANYYIDRTPGFSFNPPTLTVPQTR